MFSRIPERTARYIRRTLAVGWLILIVSLFWDPTTLLPSRPGQSGAVIPSAKTGTVGGAAEDVPCPRYQQDPATGDLRIDWGGSAPGTCDQGCPQFRGLCLVQRPNPLGARIFWSVIIPLLPLFLLVFGHEAWRRICPLSFFSQIPRALGIQLTRKSINPGTGLIEKKIVLIGEESWLARYRWFVQFGLLFAGVSARILLINSDRVALGVFLIGVIGAAITVGFLFGGKTWCNYFCPIAPVQKFYSEPRGIFESEAHQTRQLITQSMCRTTNDDGTERSACVSCASPCPDIDLERAYWDGIDTSGRRFFYYGYFGLVAGYYLFYTLLSGNWDYAFISAWNQQALHVTPLPSPDYYIFGYSIFFPKLMAVPILIGLTILVSYGIGRLLEIFIAQWLRRHGHTVPRSQILHGAFAITTFLTINLFYAVGGPKSWAFLPSFPIAVFNIAVLLFGSFWLWRTLSRTSRVYQREGMADSLRRQLGMLNLDFTQLLDGRTLEELNPDETYVLAKTLPGFSQHQRQRVYKEMLRDTLSYGHANSANSLALMKDLRQQMEITEQEHGRILMELGIEDSSLLDPDIKRSQENQLRLTSYRNAIGSLVMQMVEAGTPMRRALQRPEVMQQIEELQALYSITQEEQDQVLAQVLGEQSGLLRDVRTWLAQLREITVRLIALSNIAQQHATAFALLESGLSGRTHFLCERLINVLQVLEDAPEAAALAHALVVLAPRQIEEILHTPSRQEGKQSATAHDLDPHIMDILVKKSVDYDVSEPTTIPIIQAHQLVEDAPPARRVLQEFIHDGEPVVQCAALHLLCQTDGLEAGKQARELLSHENVHWLVHDLATSILGQAASEDTITSGRDYKIEEMTTFLKLVFLFENSFFNHLALDVLTEMARDAQVRVYPQGTVICREGDPSDELLIISSGLVEVFVRAQQGDRKVVTLPAGQTIGESGVLTHKPRSATVVAGEQPVTVMAMNGHQFEEYLSQSPHTALSFLRMAIERWQQTTSQLSNYG